MVVDRHEPVVARHQKINWPISRVVSPTHDMINVMSEYESPISGAPTDDYWMSQARWYGPEVDAARFGKIVDVLERTVRQYAVRGVEGFPEPLERGTRNRWSYHQVYTMIINHRPAYLERIPRLYTPGRHLAPAVFMFAEAVCTGKSEPEFVVHHWLPADGKGVVAIAYALESDQMGLHEERARELLEHLDDVSAVAIPTTEMMWKPGQGHQMRVLVADHSKPVLSEGTKDLGALAYGWFDLANLLRVDIPWWPWHLRDRDAMLSWFPGAPPREVRPRGGQYSDGTLRALIPATMPATDHPRLSKLVDIINRRREDVIISNAQAGGDASYMTEQPGYTIAARPLFRLPEVPDEPAPNHIRWLLHQQIADPVVADQAASVLNPQPELEPIVKYTFMTVTRDGLAAEWASRLTRRRTPESLELGYAFARRGLSTGRAPESWWSDPEIPDMWIIRDDEGRLHATIGVSVPASGYLTELEVRQESTFFRDSAGVVWPMPAPTFGYYLCGYPGNGPRQLTEMVTALRFDAGLDTRTVEIKGADSALWRLLSTQEPTLHLTSAQLDDLVPREHAGDLTSASS